MTTEEKIEEFRKWLRYWPHDPIEASLYDKFNELFPPPRRAGAWCFFANCRGENNRCLISSPTEDEAKRLHEACDNNGCNPGPVFFLAEEEK